MPKVDNTALDLENQLELFSPNRTRYEHTDSIRQTGGETLARTPSPNGARTGGQRPTANDAARSGTQDQRRNGHAANATDEAGQNGRAGAPSGLGDRARALHPAAGRNGEPVVPNQNGYRISDDDRLGAGGPKQKFSQNVRAIQTLRKLEAEKRPASPDEKAMLVKYVGWGAMTQVFNDNNQEWTKERATRRGEIHKEEFEDARKTTLNAHYTS